MCILSGCDYLPSVPGIGLSTAHKLMKKYAKNVNNVSNHSDSNVVILCGYHGALSIAPGWDLGLEGFFY